MLAEMKTALFEFSDTIRMPIVFSDPELPDCPVVHCNGAFEAMTGYKRAVLVGQNCRILQGPDTDDDAKEFLRQTIKNKTSGSSVVLNYRADGTAFNNFLFIETITLAGKAQLLMGCQNEFKTFRAPSEISSGSSEILEQHRKLRLNFHEHDIMMQDTFKMRSETAVMMVRNYLLCRRARLDATLLSK